MLCAAERQKTKKYNRTSSAFGFSCKAVVTSHNQSHPGVIPWTQSSPPLVSITKLIQTWPWEQREVIAAA